MSNKRLYKTSQGAMLGGVCKGISEYLNIDVTLIRLVWVLISFTSVGIILYIACVFIFPDKQRLNVRNAKLQRMPYLKQMIIK